MDNLDHIVVNDARKANASASTATEMSLACVVLKEVLMIVGKSSPHPENRLLNVNCRKVATVKIQMTVRLRLVFHPFQGRWDTLLEETLFFLDSKI